MLICPNGHLRTKDVTGKYCPQCGATLVEIVITYSPLYHKKPLLVQDGDLCPTCVSKAEYGDYYCQECGQPIRVAHPSIGQPRELRVRVENLVIAGKIGEAISTLTEAKWVIHRTVSETNPREGLLLYISSEEGTIVRDTAYGRFYVWDLATLKDLKFTVWLDSDDKEASERLLEKVQRSGVETDFSWAVDSWALPALSWSIKGWRSTSAIGSITGKGSVLKFVGSLLRAYGSEELWKAWHDGEDLREHAEDLENLAQVLEERN